MRLIEFCQGNKTCYECETCPTIFGYPLHELRLLAIVIEKAGVLPHDLHEFCQNVREGYKAGWELFEDMQRKELERVLKSFHNSAAFSIPIPREGTDEAER